MEKIFEKNIQKETPEKKIKRLRPVFESSLDVFNNPEISLWEGAITVTRRLSDGRMESVSSLVCVEINEDGPMLAGIDEEGEPTASATMLWKEIIDAKKKSLAKPKP